MNDSEQMRESVNELLVWHTMAHKGLAAKKKKRCKQKSERCKQKSECCKQKSDRCK